MAFAEIVVRRSRLNSGVGQADTWVYPIDGTTKQGSDYVPFVYGMCFGSLPLTK